MSIWKYLLAGGVGFVVAKLFEDDKTPKYANGGLIVGEYDDDNKFPTKEEAFELIQDSIDSQGTYFIDEDGDGRFESEEQAQKYVDEIYDFFDYYYSLGMIPVYRSVSADEVDLDPYSIGESWSLYLDNAKQFASHLGTSRNLKIISAYVPNNNVDWESAFRLYPLFSDLGDGDSEFELPIPANNKLYDVKVSDLKEAKELEPYQYADGGSVLLAPNGKPSNLTHEQYKLVRSQAFKNWFGDWENDRENSGKVSGKTKEPVVFYHSTKSNFLSKKGENIFKNPPFFFSFKKDVSDYIVRIQHQNKKGRVYTKPFFLKYHNTFDLRQVKILKDKELTRLIKKHTFYQTESDIRLFEIKLSLSKFSSNTWFLTENEDFQDYIKNKGYDSFVVYEDGDKNIAVFNPNQIKLADGTNTTFDSNNPDIRFDGGGLIENELNIVIKEVSNDNKYKGNYKKIFDLIEKNTNFYNPYGTSFEELKGNDFYITITPKPEPFIIEQISRLKDVVISNNPFIRYVNGGLIAPNGKPSNLTPEQYKLVRTPAFKNWFGDWENSPENASKVVDKNGEPLVLHRGNLVNQEELGHTFNLGQNFLKKQNSNQFGFFFTNNIDIAKKYMLVDHFDEIQGGSITSVFIQSNKTLDLLDFDLKIGQDNFIDVLIKKGVSFDNQYKYLERKIRDFDTDSYKGWGYNVFDYFDVFPELRNLFMENGFNSVIFYEMSRTYSKYKVYVAFEPNQIKLADGTNTTFDGDNPDIRYVGGGILNKLSKENVDININENFFSGITDINYTLGETKAHIQFFGEPMGIEGIPSWAKKEFYIKNIYRDNEKGIKGSGLILLKKIFEHAKRNSVDIITLKRAEYSGEKLRNYYTRIGFVDVGKKEPLGMYLDLRTNEPLKKIDNIIKEQIKLADGTNTTFDSNNPDIRFKEGGEITNYKEFYDNLQIEDGSKYIGQKFSEVFPFLGRRKIPNDLRIDINRYYGVLKRIEEDNYSTKAMKQRDLNKLERTNKVHLQKKEYLSRFYLNQSGTIIIFDNSDNAYAGGGKVKKVKFDIESREGEEDRTTISINGIGQVVLVETYPEYEFIDDIGEDELEELGIEEGDMIGKIEHIQIEDKYKGQGYAKLLMNKAIEVAKEKGLMPLYFNASPMGREGLNLNDLTSLYESLGFEVFLEQGNNNLMILN